MPVLLADKKAEWGFRWEGAVVKETDRERDYSQVRSKEQRCPELGEEYTDFPNVSVSLVSPDSGSRSSYSHLFLRKEGRAGRHLQSETWCSLGTFQKERRRARAGVRRGERNLGNAVGRGREERLMESSVRAPSRGRTPGRAPVVPKRRGCSKN